MKIAPISCPCCRRPVQVPTVEIVVDHYKVKPLEARILGAVWKGEGHLVPRVHSGGEPDFATLERGYPAAFHDRFGDDP